MYIIPTAVDSKTARQFATMWKTASAAERELLTKKHSDCFTLQIVGSRSTFIFNADGSVKTVNPPRTESQPVRRSAKVDVDWSRKMIGWEGNRPIYA